MTATKMNAQEIIQFIANAEKDKCKSDLEGQLAGDILLLLPNLEMFFLRLEISLLFLKDLAENKDYVVEQDVHPPYLSLINVISMLVSSQVLSSVTRLRLANAVIMMGAVINIGAERRAGTMIDMGAYVDACYCW